MISPPHLHNEQAALGNRVDLALNAGAKEPGPTSCLAAISGESGSLQHGSRTPYLSRLFDGLPALHLFSNSEVFNNVCSLDGGAVDEGVFLLESTAHPSPTLEPSRERSG